MRIKVVTCNACGGMVAARCACVTAHGRVRRSERVFWSNRAGVLVEPSGCFGRSERVFWSKREGVLVEAR
eukprot:6205521-Pleurochrysis_carterae.AAC.3